MRTLRSHPHVPHPNLRMMEQAGWINGVVARVASNVLGSMALFWVAFVIPLVTIPASDSVKLLVSILFSSWFQAWALPVLQNAANRAEGQRAGKADADHEALTSIHQRVDQTAAQLEELHTLVVAAVAAQSGRVPHGPG